MCSSSQATWQDMSEKESLCDTCRKRNVSCPIEPVEAVENCRMYVEKKEYIMADPPTEYVDNKLIAEAEKSIEAQHRKQRPVFSGVLKYFPLALQEVAYCSWVGNEQHNPGKPLHWDRSKSADELDAMTRHMMDIDGVDTDGCRHAAKVAWRALAYLQKLLEAEK